MSANIGGMVFFELLLKDGEINPDLGAERLQEDDGEFSDDASQFTTKEINDPKYYDIFDNIVNRPSQEEPPEEVSEGVQDSSQTGVTAVENSAPGPISKNSLPCLEMELLLHPGAYWEDHTTPKGRSTTHDIISVKSPYSYHLTLKLAKNNVVFFICQLKYSN